MSILSNLSRLQPNFHQTLLSCSILPKIIQYGTLHSTLKDLSLNLLQVLVSRHDKAVFSHSDLNPSKSVWDTLRKSSGLSFLMNCIQESRRDLKIRGLEVLSIWLSKDSVRVEKEWLNLEEVSGIQFRRNGSSSSSKISSSSSGSSSNSSCSSSAGGGGSCSLVDSLLTCRLDTFLQFLDPLYQIISHCRPFDRLPNFLVMESKGNRMESGHKIKPKISPPTSNRASNPLSFSKTLVTPTPFPSPSLTTPSPTLFAPLKTILTLQSSSSNNMEPPSSLIELMLRKGLLDKLLSTLKVISQDPDQTLHLIQTLRILNSLKSRVRHLHKIIGRRALASKLKYFGLESGGMGRSVVVSSLVQEAIS